MIIYDDRLEMHIEGLKICYDQETQIFRLKQDFLPGLFLTSKRHTLY